MKPSRVFPPVWRSRATRRRIRRLVLDLEGRGTESLEPPLRRALGDDGLEVAFWLSDPGMWVDATGRGVSLSTAGAARAITRVEGSEGPLAALVHSPRLLRDRRLLEAVAAAAHLALENERLEAELRVRIAEVRASRERLVAKGDAERRRIERDLHDGAQQRLVSLSLGLQMVALRMGETVNPRSVDLLQRGMEVARVAIDELRGIAHGIFPAALAEEGLAAALEDFAVAAPATVRLAKTPQRRAPPGAETAAYFAAVEAVRTAARLDPCAEIALAAQVHCDRLELAVDHVDTRAGDLCSVELKDRVDAVGGTVSGGAGWLRVEIPMGDAAA